MFGASRSDLPALGLAAVLGVVSTHTAMNLGGPALVVGVDVALVLGAVAALVVRPARPVLLGIAVVVGVVLVAAAVHGPLPTWADALGTGSDRANALDVALDRLAAGRYPYTGLTYVGNPITPLPGSLLLAAPVWALTGHAAAQNVVWTLALLPLLHGGWRLRPAPTLLWVLVVATPEVWREYLVGDDLVSSVVPVLGATLWVLRARTPVVLTTGAVALGVATCTRPHLALVVVIVAVGVALRPSPGARRSGLLVGTVGAASWAVLIVPFLLGGTDRFSPLHVGAKVTGERGLHPAIVVVALAALALLAVVLVRLRPTSEAALGWCTAAVLIAPTVLSAGLWLLLTGNLADADLTLGAGAVPVAAWAVAAGVDSPRGEEPPRGASPRARTGARRSRPVGA